MSRASANESENGQICVAESSDIAVDYSFSIGNSWAGSEDCLMIPVSVFSNPSLGGLESVTRYLKDCRGFRFCEIARLLNRDARTVRGAYIAGIRKAGDEQESDYDGRYSIPLPLLCIRELSILEVITEYLKETKKLRYCQIAALISRDDRTVWTAYHRAKVKRENE
ncbi:MAG: hypothetical protein ABH879_07185 [archaeon]